MKIRSFQAAAVAALALLVVGAVAEAAGFAWAVVASPNKTPVNYLNSVAGSGPTDVWAVGYAYRSGTSVASTLVEHWNGSAWSIVPSPSPGTEKRCGAATYAGSILYGVTALSISDAWAVGTICPAGPARTLVEHWDGNAWTVVQSPYKSGATNTLVGVSARGPDDVWAVGNYLLDQQYKWETLTEHWNGNRWSIVPSPNASRGQKSFLNAVVSLSASDAWAVGYSEDTQSAPYDLPLIEHFTGNGWRIEASPHVVGSPYNGLYGIAAVGPDDIWASGYENVNRQGKNGSALVEHWNGSTWSLVDSPVAGSATTLYGLAARSSADVWGVGYTDNAQTEFFPVSEHWDGVRWSVVQTPDPGQDAALFGIASVPGEVWAVGAYSDQSHGGLLENPKTLTLRMSIEAPHL